ncbi:MAG TPA: carboxypeptidase-like regulatory domain-containing protein, partial [Gemmatimonadaceae bacterium]|nr:carboxypeptidase-like regulatory domain-containing protein [Gemmatimonadaceae bacterium]
MELRSMQPGGCQPSIGKSRATRAWLAAWLLVASLFVASMPVRGGSLDAQTPAAAPSATGVIDGTVTDTNLVALGDAVAAIIGSNLRVATGANGKFRIVGLKPGVYILIVSRHGFVPATTRLDVPSNPDTLRVSF